MPEKELRCVFYCRVARDEGQDAPSAVERQREMLADYARSMGYTVTDVYTDNGCSGLDPERPAYKRLNADIASGKVDTVITKDPSRLWRDGARCAEWLHRMDKRGVTVLCHDAPGFQKELTDTHAEFSKLFKRTKKKQERHTVRTPPPQGKTR